MKTRGSNSNQKSSEQAVNLFISYSHEDEPLRKRLETHLTPLQRQGIIHFWSDRKISAGNEWEKDLQNNFERARVILLLISPGYLASNYCSGIEMPRALEKHQMEEARVIPVILRPVNWHDERFSKLQVLPKGAKPVSTWEEQDEAWVDVVKNIKSACEEILGNRSLSSISGSDDADSRQFRQLIPTPVMHPVGRHEDIEKVVRLLKAYNSVAITGIAGVGKTTVLAFSVREIESMGTFPYSHICFHRIAEQGSREERLNRLLLSLISCLSPHISVKAENESVQFTRIQRLMANKRMLVAVDNADDDESRDIVQKVRSRLPNLVIAVTSRHSLWRDFEKVRVEGLSDQDGITLFKEKKAFPSLKGTGMNHADEESITLLCRQVKGHPMMITHLALEARERGILPKKLINQLEFNIDRDLALRFNSVVERLPGKCHEVLDVIGLLVTDTLQVDLLRRVLGVTMEDLDTMADRLIIHIHFNRLRFTVHELIRTWCRSRLESREEQKIHLIPKIVEFYLQFLKKRRMGTPTELAEIDNEWPNILGLLDRLLDTGSESHSRLAFTLVDEAIGDHFDDPNGYIPRRRQMSGLIDEPRTKPRVERLLEECDNVKGLLAARIAKNLGHFFYWRGDFEKAELLFHRARERYRKHGSVEGEASATWLLGYLADDLNHYKESQDLYLEGTRLAEQVTPFNGELVAIGHHLIGCNLYHQGKFNEAETEFYRARGLIDRRTAPHLMARIERRLAFVSLRLGRLDEAERMLEGIKQEVDQLERPRDAYRIARQMALLYLERGELQKAEESLNRALKGFKELNARRGIGYTKHCLAILRRKQGRIEEAKELCRESRKIAKETKSLYGQAAAHQELANILEQEGAREEAVSRELLRAYNIYSVIGNLRAQDIKIKLKEIGAMKPKLPKNIKGILFDLMDTLAYIEPGVYEKTLQDIADCLGVSFERFKWAWTRSRKSAQTGLFKTTEERVIWVGKELRLTGENHAQADMYVEMAEKVEAMWRNEVKLFAETRPLLDTLKKKGFSLAVVSNGPVAMKCLKESLGISSYLDDFLISCEAGVPKPEKLIYRRSLEKLGLNPEQCIFIGDGNDHELDGASELKLYTIKINRLQPSYATIKNASLYWNLEVGDLAELLALFQNLT